MSTNTYVALDKVTIGTATNTATISSIPQGYTDLVLRMDIVGFSATDEIGLRINSDTGNTYSRTIVYGNGTNALSSRNISSAVTEMRVGSYQSAQQTIEVNFMNYSNTLVYKTVLSKGGGVSGIVGAGSHLWQNTNAITSITVRTSGGANFTVGTTFSLYGIKSWTNEITPKATGGYVYSDSTYWYHAFPFSSTFVPNQSLSCDILQVAGGGGSGHYRSGGGGAGGLLTFTSQSLSATSYNVTVGGGGSGGLTSGSAGTNGSNSQFASLTASVGGGLGAAGNSSTTGLGGNGGSGGGGSGYFGDKAGGTGTSGQGFAGGTGSDTFPYAAGGGGGAAAAGATGSGTVAGAGGIGATSALINAIGAATGTGEQSGSNYYYAGGGGGGLYATGTPGAGGLGGGGNGAPAYGRTAVPGRWATGGGAGGSGTDTGGGFPSGVNGGSGIVVIRYAK